MSQMISGAQQTCFALVFDKGTYTDDRVVGVMAPNQLDYQWFISQVGSSKATVEIEPNAEYPNQVSVITKAGSGRVQLKLWVREKNTQWRNGSEAVYNIHVIPSPPGYVRFSPISLHPQGVTVHQVAPSSPGGKKSIDVQSWSIGSNGRLYLQVVTQNGEYLHANPGMFAKYSVIIDAKYKNQYGTGSVYGGYGKYQLSRNLDRMKAVSYWDVGTGQRYLSMVARLESTESVSGPLKNVFSKIAQYKIDHPNDEVNISVSFSHPPKYPEGREWNSLLSLNKIIDWYQTALNLPGNSPEYTETLEYMLYLSRQRADSLQIQYYATTTAANAAFATSLMNALASSSLVPSSPPPPPPALNIFATITPNSPTLSIGGSQTLTATLKVDGKEQYPDGFAWRWGDTTSQNLVDRKVVNNKIYASVFTAKAVGTAKIRAVFTYKGGTHTATATMKIQPPSISISPADIVTTSVGKDVWFHATLGAGLNTNTQVKWYVNDKLVATRPASQRCGATSSTPKNLKVQAKITSGNSTIVSNVVTVKVVKAVLPAPKITSFTKSGFGFQLKIEGTNLIIDGTNKAILGDKVTVFYLDGLLTKQKDYTYKQFFGQPDFMGYPGSLTVLDDSKTSSGKYLLSQVTKVVFTAANDRGTSSKP